MPTSTLGICPSAVKHLLANAITYTGAEGKISVKARKQQDQVEISVEDNGRGLPNLTDPIFSSDHTGWIELVLMEPEELE